MLFIADKLIVDHRDPSSPYPGGAEQTDAALLEAAPGPVQVRRFVDTPVEAIRDADVVIVGNSGEASREQLQALTQHRRMILFEHDLRICRMRGNFSHGIHPSHRVLRACLCRRPDTLALYPAAVGTIYLTQMQRKYYRRNPFYHEGPYRVLGSSVMNRAFFERVAAVAESAPDRTIEAAVAYSGHRNKGYPQALRRAQRMAKDVTVIKGKTPDEVLEILSHTRHFVYTPTSPEWGSRLSLEARFLGAKVTTNGLVGVAQEPWWGWPDAEALEHLRGAAQRFWTLVDELLDQR